MSLASEWLNWETGLRFLEKLFTFLKEVELKYYRVNFTLPIMIFIFPCPVQLHLYIEPSMLINIEEDQKVGPWSNSLLSL